MRVKKKFKKNIKGETAELAGREEAEKRNLREERRVYIYTGTVRNLC
jgi:hypothetical protein